MKLKNKDIKLVIFDLDGTLLDSCQIWKEVDNNFFKRRNIPLPSDYSRAIAHMGFDNASRYTKERFHLEESCEDIISEWENEVLSIYHNEVDLKDGAKDLLNYLKENKIILCIATANQKNCYMPCLERNNVINYFSEIVDVKNYKNGKNSPEIYLDIAKKFNISPSSCLVIEDILVALEVANRGGFNTCAIYEKTCDEEKEKKNEATFYISSFNDLLKMFKESN